MPATLREPAGTVEEPIQGWRVWHVGVEADGTPRLLPAGSGVDAWKPGVAVEARCAVGRVLSLGRPAHTSPGSSCTCGVYASRSIEDFERTAPAYPGPTVVGTVSLWGRVIEHERGWRARYAYPSRIRLVCILCAWLEPGLGTPAVVHRFFSTLYALCEEHRGGVQLPDGRRTRPADVDPIQLQARLLGDYSVDLLPAEQVLPLLSRPPAPAPAAYVPTIRAVRDPGPSP